jgi:hypothetical protein
MKRLFAIALSTTAVATVGLSAPGAAQDVGGDKVNTIIVYGDDACPPSTGEQITVCARMDEGERFRIPENLRESGSPANESWANRVKAFETVGEFGPLSCSPFGAGGELGCTAKMIETAYAEKRQGSNVRFGQLIAAARQERLATIDAEAAETQGRVEEVERQYQERIRREQDAADAAAGNPPAAAPATAAPRVINPLAIPPGK